jgi:hypothetical protein
MIDSGFPEGEYLYLHRGLWVIDPGQILRRGVPACGLDWDTLQEFLQRMIDTHHGMGDEYTCRDGHFVYFSKGLGFGLIADYEDPNRAGGPRSFIVRALLPRLADGDGLPVPRAYDIRPYYELIDDVDDFCLYLSRLFTRNRGERITERDRKYDYSTKTVVTGGFALKVILVSGMLWDLFGWDLMVIE